MGALRAAELKAVVAGVRFVQVRDPSTTRAGYDEFKMKLAQPLPELLGPRCAEVVEHFNAVFDLAASAVRRVAKRKDLPSDVVALFKGPSTKPRDGTHMPPLHAVYTAANLCKHQRLVVIAPGREMYHPRIEPDDALVELVKDPRWDDTAQELLLGSVPSAVKVKISPVMNVNVYSVLPRRRGREPLRDFLDDCSTSVLSWLVKLERRATELGYFPPRAR